MSGITGESASTREWKPRRGSVAMAAFGFGALLCIALGCLVAAFFSEREGAIVLLSVAFVLGLCALYAYGFLNLRRKARIAVAPDRVDIVTAKSIWLPVLRSLSLRPDEIVAVETRQEVMEGQGKTLPERRMHRMLAEVGTLTTRSGETITFAYTHDEALPVTEIAAAIAAAAGVSVSDLGARKRGLMGLSGGGRAWEGRRLTREELRSLDL